MRGYVYLSLFASTIVGIVLSRFLGPWSLLVVGCALAPCAFALARRRKWAWAASLTAVFALLGASMMLLSSASVAGGVLARGAQLKSVASVLGRVVSVPMTKGGGTSFFLDASEASIGTESWKTRERLYVTVEGRLDDRTFYQGVRVEARGRLTIAGQSTRWLLDRGAGCILRCANPTVLHRAGPPDLLSRLVAASRRQLSEAYGRLFDRRTAGFVEGVTISKLDNMQPQTISDLRAGGLSHIVSVSGLHVASAAMLVLAVTATLGAGRRTRYVAAGTMAVVVLSLANFCVPAMRSAVMAIACFGGAIAGRKYDSLVALSIAGTLLVFLNPRATFDLSFQYSFAAALGIILIAARVRKASTPSRLRMGLSVCAGAQLGTLPLMIARGDAVPVSAIAANMLVVWLVGVLLVSGLAAAVLTLVSLPMARAVALLPAGLSRYTLSVAAWCGRVPGAGTFMGALSLTALVLYMAALVMFARAGDGRSLVRPAGALCLSILLVLFGCFPVVRTGSGPSMIVIDVGEGDATLLCDGSGGVVLVDGGPDPEVLVNRLRARGISRIDLMVSTHPHADHALGLAGVMRQMPVGRLLVPGLPQSKTESIREVLSEARARKIPVTVGREGQVIDVSPEIRLEVLYSPASLGRTPENLNNCSLVCMASIAGGKALLMGDLETDAQLELVGSHPSIDCDVLKVPHHGSANAAGRELLSAADPELATISLGKDNKLGHPSPVCLEMLRARGVSVARTDLSGDIVIRFGGGKIALEKRR